MNKILILIASLCIANSSTASIEIINSSNKIQQGQTSASVSTIDTKGSGYVMELCYRNMLFIKHKDMNQTGGLAQVFDPDTGKPVMCKSGD